MTELQVSWILCGVNLQSLGICHFKNSISINDLYRQNMGSSPHDLLVYLFSKHSTSLVHILTNNPGYLTMRESEQHNSSAFHISFKRRAISFQTFPWNSIAHGHGKQYSWNWHECWETWTWSWSSPQHIQLKSLSVITQLEQANTPPVLATRNPLWLHPSSHKNG